MKVFSHCELDHFEDGCVGCKADGKGDCAAVFVEVAPLPRANWSRSWDWRSWLIGAVKVGRILVIHIGPFCMVRIG